MSFDQLNKKYLPMSETAYYILLSLKEPRHGYGIMQFVEEITKGRIKLGPGTLYGSLSKMEKDELIVLEKEENKRKSYKLTEDGSKILQAEISRITELYENGKKYKF